MNAVEIEEAVSELVSQPFDPAEFPFQFLTAFGAKDTTIKRLRKGESNASDVAGGVLQRNNIHVAVGPAGMVGETLAVLRTSPKTGSQKVKFLLATDGEMVEAEDLLSGETVACAFADLPRHFGFFLPLAGISTVKEIKNNPIDVKATGRLNRLYVELLKDNPDWGTEARRRELNQFMARLIFCFFAEDTGIFRQGSFTATITQMSHAGHGSGEEQWGNTHEVLQHLFLAMDTPVTHEGNFDDRYRRAAGIRPWADVFPYVNGGLFTGASECPRFSRTARAYLLRAGELDWKEINPDIFGSMIQAVADDGERGELGMHYTSVPNILKVLNPLFLDDLREQLEAAGDNRRKLQNLRKRLANIRVFDPACGSGNFLVIAYKEMRAVEAQIVERLGGEANLKLGDRRSVIPLSNFFGIEIKGFAVEIARLALLIAEFQADCLYLSQQEARAMVLPLHRTGEIKVGNALRLDWLTVCPPMETVVATEHDLGGPTGRLALDANQLGLAGAGETYVCGNPPFKGARKQLEDQKQDLHEIFGGGNDYKDCDYVSGWYLKAASYLRSVRSEAAFVSTSSICEGEQVQHIWGRMFQEGSKITFAYRPFGWRNSATNNAVVTCVIVGLGHEHGVVRGIFEGTTFRSCQSISPYLVPGQQQYVAASDRPISSDLSRMVSGSMPRDGGHLILSNDERSVLIDNCPGATRIIKRFSGTSELTNGSGRWCLWIEDGDIDLASSNPEVSRRIGNVKAFRESSSAKTTREYARIPHKFAQRSHKAGGSIIVGATSSENRPYLPADWCNSETVISNAAYAIYSGKLFELGVLVSRIHLVWVATVCGRMKTDFRYSKTLGWNTFPVPKLTEQNKADLARTAENILLAREAHFPATIADLYDPEAMPEDLRRAHEENDEVLERIYIGRRFRNDTERLEKLFDLYTRIAEATAPVPARRSKAH